MKDYEKLDPVQILLVFSSTLHFLLLSFQVMYTAYKLKVN